MLDSAPLLESPRAAASHRPRRPIPRRLGVPRPLRSRCGSGYPTSNPPPNQGAALAESAETSFLLRAPPFKVGVLFPIQNLYHHPPPPCAVQLLLRASAVLFALSCFGGTALQNRMPVLGRRPAVAPPCAAGFSVIGAMRQAPRLRGALPQSLPPKSPRLFGVAPRVARWGGVLSQSKVFSRVQWVSLLLVIALHLSLSRHFLAALAAKRRLPPPRPSRTKAS